MTRYELNWPFSGIEIMPDGSAFVMVHVGEKPAETVKAIEAAQRVCDSCYLNFKNKGIECIGVQQNSPGVRVQGNLEEARCINQNTTLEAYSSTKGDQYVN